MQRKNQYFKYKGKKAIWRWFEIKDSPYAAEFIINKIEELNLLAIFNKEIAKNRKERLVFNKFKHAIVPILKEKGCWGEQDIVLPDGAIERIMFFNEERLESIYSSNLYPDIISNRLKAAKEADGSHPYCLFLTEIDAYTRPSHAALHLKAFLDNSQNNPIWENLLPPNGFGCRCRILAISEEGMEEWGATLCCAIGKPYKIEIETKMGRGKTIKQYTTAVKCIDRQGNAFITYSDLGFDKRKPQSFSFFIPELDKTIQEVIATQEQGFGLRAFKKIKKWFYRKNSKG